MTAEQDTMTPKQAPGRDTAATAGQRPAAADRPGTLATRIRRSFTDSAGSIVFGMEDGTVSIFGLVFGVAAAAPDARAVLLAGGTGAVAAAVSMMAGTFLDVQTANDQAAAKIAEERARYDADPRQADQDVHRRLVSAGFSDPEAATVTGIIGRHPDTRLKIAAAVDLGAGEATRQNPYVQSAWMFVTDLFAAAVPVIPFALFDLATARIISLAVTFVLLVFLGLGRARVGHRRILPTVIQTVGIATAAAVAGVAVGKLLALVHPPLNTVPYCGMLAVRRATRRPAGAGRAGPVPAIGLAGTTSLSRMAATGRSHPRRSTSSACSSHSRGGRCRWKVWKCSGMCAASSLQAWVSTVSSSARSAQLMSRPSRSSEPGAGR